MSEREFFNRLFAFRNQDGTLSSSGYAEMAKDGRGTIIEQSTRLEIPIVLPAGRTVKVLAVRRRGGFFVTTDLDATTGFIAQFSPGDGFLTNCRFER